MMYVLLLLFPLYLQWWVYHYVHDCVCCVRLRYCAL